MELQDGERREFVRIRVEVPVRYKFVTRMTESVTVTERIFEGFTRNLSAGGFLLVGKIPNMDYLQKLLAGQVFVGINLDLPSYGIIKALMKTSWLESFEEGAKSIRMGLLFKEITKEAQDELFKFIIKQQMP